jgi:hypothetical protein
MWGVIGRHLSSCHSTQIATGPVESATRAPKGAQIAGNLDVPSVLEVSPRKSRTGRCSEKSEMHLSNLGAAGAAIRELRQK